MDGSTFSIPYDKDSAYAVENRPGRPRKDGGEVKPVGRLHANLLYDILDRTYEDCIIQPWESANERDAAVEMVKRLDCGKHIVIMDRGYSAVNMVETLNRIDGCYYVIRTKAGESALNEIAALPNQECDKVLTFDVTTSLSFYKEYCKSIPNLKYVRCPKNPYKDDKSKKEFFKLFGKIERIWRHIESIGIV